MNFKKITFALVFGVIVASNGAFSQEALPQNEAPPTNETAQPSPDIKVNLNPRANRNSASQGQYLFGATPQVQEEPAPLLFNIPQPPPSKEEIAKSIAPNFDVVKDYQRLSSCYGTADFLVAFLRVRANQPGANMQTKQMANQIEGLKAAMQPFVLAVSTVKSEKVFRKDYDGIAKSLSNQFVSAKNPEAFLQAQLKKLNSCGQTLNRWNGVK